MGICSSCNRPYADGLSPFCYGCTPIRVTDNQRITELEAEVETLRIAIKDIEYHISSSVEAALKNVRKAKKPSFEDVTGIFNKKEKK